MALSGNTVQVLSKRAKNHLTPPPERILKVSATVLRSRLVQKVEPIYPHVAIAAGIEGYVIVQIMVDEGGFVSKVRVISGRKILVDSAVQAVKQRRYIPMIVNGKSMPVIAAIVIKFRITRSKGL